MSIFGKLACKLWGHKRGKRVKRPADPPAATEIMNAILGVEFQCPRCGATWTRKAKAQA